MFTDEYFMLVDDLTCQIWLKFGIFIIFPENYLATCQVVVRNLNLNFELKSENFQHN